MIENKLLTNLQHGFVLRKICKSVLLIMMYILTEAVKNNVDVDLVYLDFAKVFDSVPHRKMLNLYHNSSEESQQNNGTNKKIK